MTLLFCCELMSSHAKVIESHTRKYSQISDCARNNFTYHRMIYDATIIEIKEKNEQFYSASLISHSFYLSFIGRFF